jgi:hypothetical protein
MAVVIQKGNLLNAATATGPGPTTVLDKIYRTFAFNKRVTGGFAALVVNYEGSIDGTNWYQLGTDNAVTAAPTFTVDKPAAYVRANVATFTGGTNVSVDFAAGGD